jgi:predicted double-glycine peptidase
MRGSLVGQRQVQSRTVVLADEWLTKGPVS